MIKRRKIYTLYGMPGGPISSKTEDYEGHSMNVVAVSVKQAYYFAANGVWVEDPENPLGLLEYYRRGAGDPGDHFLWCGCRIFGDLTVGHGSGIRKIKKAIANHLTEHHDEQN
jgi:hypothetical protein